MGVYAYSASEMCPTISSKLVHAASIRISQDGFLLPVPGRETVTSSIFTEYGLPRYNAHILAIVVSNAMIVKSS
jgi:hypothetical protein